MNFNNKSQNPNKMLVPGTNSLRWSWIILFGSCFLLLLFLLRKIFSEKIKKNNEQD
jgi:hypothetical protein